MHPFSWRESSPQPPRPPTTSLTLSLKELKTFARDKIAAPRGLHWRPLSARQIFAKIYTYVCMYVCLSVDSIVQMNCTTVEEFEAGA